MVFHMADGVPTDLAVLIGKLDGKIDVLQSTLMQQNAAISLRVDNLDSEINSLKDRVREIDAGRKIFVWLASGIPTGVTAVLWLFQYLSTGKVL